MQPVKYWEIIARKISCAPISFVRPRTAIIDLADIAAVVDVAVATAGIPVRLRLSGDKNRSLMLTGSRPDK
jgi:hypothetical protein